MLARRIVSGVKRVVAGYGDAFVMTVRTTAPNETFTWPGRNQETDALFDWGDGTNDHITSYNQSELLHTYATAGDYDIQVTGACGAPYFNNSGSKLKVRNIKNWGNLGGATDWSNALYGCSNLVVDATDDFGSIVTNVVSMFRGCTAFNSPISNFDLSQTTAIESFLYGCSSFDQEISPLAETKATSYRNVLRECESFNKPIGGLIKSNTVNVNSMLFRCLAFNQPLSGLSFIKVSDADNFLYLCTSLSQANVDGFLQRLYQDRLLRTSAAPTLVLPTAPSGTYQDASPPTTGKEYEWQLENGSDVTYKWSITY